MDHVVSTISNSIIQRYIISSLIECDRIIISDYQVETSVTCVGGISIAVVNRSEKYWLKRTNMFRLYNTVHIKRNN